MLIAKRIWIWARVVRNVQLLVLMNKTHTNTCPCVFCTFVSRGAGPFGGDRGGYRGRFGGLAVPDGARLG